MDNKILTEETKETEKEAGKEVENSSNRKYGNRKRRN